MTSAAPSLVTIVVRRIVLFSALAMLAQLIGVIAEYWLDEQQIGRHIIQSETSSLYRGVQRLDGHLEFELPADMRGRYGHAAGDYFARVRTGAGAILFSNCPGQCDGRFLPLGSAPMEFWVTRIQPGEPSSVAGGRSFGEKDALILVDVAIVRDRDSVLTGVLGHEVIDHMLLPMSLMLVVVLGATTLSIRRALKPVKDAADLAAGLDPIAPGSRLPTTGMPREIAKLTQAVNASFDTVRGLVQAQKIFTSAISHEVRTPIAAARLDLEKIADPRARKVEQDLDALNRLLEQMTTLARLENADLDPLEAIEPAGIAESVVTSLAPIVYESGRSIELVDKGAKPFWGRHALIENALRNLVENAIRHTSARAVITVEAGPGPEFCVRDEAGSLASEVAPASRQGAGLGLKIVRRIAEIHGGSFEFGETRGGSGSTARLIFDEKLTPLRPDVRSRRSDSDQRSL